MPYLPADLTYPAGELRVEWFPGEELAANLTDWLLEGTAQAPGEATSEEADAISRAFAYWRGYEAVAYRLAGVPTSASLEDLSRTVSDGRVKFFLDKAAEWRTAFETAVGAVATPGVGSAPPRVSQSVTFSVAW